jgi:hypothetical protein
MLTAANFADLNIRWTTRDPSLDDPVVQSLKEGIENKKRRFTFDRPKATLDLGAPRIDLATYQSHLDNAAQLTDKKWCCAALLDMMVRVKVSDQMPHQLQALFAKLRLELGKGTLPLSEGVLSACRISTAMVDSLGSSSSLLPSQHDEMRNERQKYEWLMKALKKMHTVCRGGEMSRIYKRDIEQLLTWAESVIPGDDYYGVHSDMWILWAARYLLGVLAGSPVPILLRLLRCGVISASITGNIEAQRSLELLTSNLEKSVGLGPSRTAAPPINLKQIVT